MSSVAPVRAISIGVGAALVTGATLGNIGSNLMPVLLPSMADRFHLSNTTAGVVATVQLLATALAALALAPQAARPGRTTMARAGLVATVAGFALASVAPGLALLVVGNAIAGVGLGAVYAAGMAAIAATGDTDKASTVTVLGGTVVIATLIILIPEADDAWGGAAAFVILAALCLPAYWLVRALPDAPERSLGPSSGRPLPRLFLLALVLLGAVEQGAWSYCEVIGEDYAGMSAGAVSIVLSVVAVVSLAGAVLGPIACNRFGRVTVMAAFFGVEVVAKLVITVVPWAASYTAAAIIWQISYMGLLVLVLAVAASADPSGRWIAATSGATAIGTGLGSAPVGWILDVWGASGLGAVLALATLLAAIPIMRTTRTVSTGFAEPLELADVRT
ncbi:MFS transporter [Actinomadura fibrosa]|uniref:MFS transporter n=1 Tax=Actinomadura fibrosa TaxID=111802 RepID=A0ABW2XHW6_9ACTN|nr:MFS transporter [Actinomadura fibrosa]